MHVGAMPGNPGGFRFRGIDGRGSQQLMQPRRMAGRLWCALKIRITARRATRLKSRGAVRRKQRAVGRLRVVLR